MKLTRHLLALAALATAAFALNALGVQPAAAQNMSLKSAEVSDGGTIKDEQVANVFGCKGGNISPSLSWSGAPSGTKSFAINVYDPDAPTGSGFWHWVVFNIPASTTSIPKNAGDVKAKLMPAGAIQSRTDYGIDGWGGPCPRKATSRITTFSRCMRSTKTRCNSPRMTAFRLLSSASSFISTASPRQSLTATYGR